MPHESVTLSITLSNAESRMPAWLHMLLICSEGACARRCILFANTFGSRLDLNSSVDDTNAVMLFRGLGAMSILIRSHWICSISAAMYVLKALCAVSVGLWNWMKGIADVLFCNAYLPTSRPIMMGDVPGSMSKRRVHVLWLRSCVVNSHVPITG